MVMSIDDAADESRDNSPAHAHELVRVVVYATRQERAELRRRAKGQGMPMAAWIRAICLGPDVPRIRKTELSYSERGLIRVLERDPTGMSYLKKDGPATLGRLLATGMVQRRAHGRFGVTKEGKRLAAEFDLVRPRKGTMYA